MKNKKKGMFLIILSLVLIFGLSIYRYKMANRPPDFLTNEEERDKYINEFAKAGEVTEDKEHISNDGGHTGVEILNKESLLQYIGLDGTLQVSTSIENTLKYLNYNINNLKSMDETNIERYFNENNNDITAIYGINNSDDFQKFINDLDINSNVASLSFDEKSIEVDGNTINLSAKILSINNEEDILKLKIVRITIKSEVNYLIYWI